MFPIGVQLKAYSINFSSGTGTGFSTKTTLMYVRAIRKF